MKCKAALDAMHAALDSEASAERLAQLHEHLRECPSCAREYEVLEHWDSVLRARDADEPGDAYFGALARGISAGVRDRQPAARLVPSWGVSWAFATACLVVGLAFGHLALPRTVTHTRTVVKTVSGPVRTVASGKAVEKPVAVPVPVEGPVVKWRTRTVIREVRVSGGGAPAARVVSAPLTLAASAGAAPAEPGGSPRVIPATYELPARQPTGTTGHMYYAMRRPEPLGDTGLSRTEMTALARRLTADVTTLDRALNSPRLAETLVSDVDSADAELERAIQPAASEGPHQ
jgi:hypothetical protein